MSERRLFHALLLGCCLLAVPVRAQNLDSLRAVWQDTTLPDSARFLACYDLVWDGYLFSDADSAMLLARAMEAEAKALHADRFTALAYDLQAAAHYVKGDMRAAIRLYEVSLPMHERTGQMGRVADVIGNMASMHLYLGAHQQALDLYDRALRQHTAHADTVGMANDINAMGAVYLARGDNARAADHFQRALRMLRQQGQQRGVITGLFNLGAVHATLGEYPTALKYYEEALVTARTIGDKDQVTKSLIEMGTCRQEMGDTAHAGQLLREALDLARQVGNMRTVATVLNKQSDLARTRGDHQRALERYTEAGRIAGTNGLYFSQATATIGAGRARLALGRKQEALDDARHAVEQADDAEELSLQRDAAELMYLVLHAQGNAAGALPWHVRFVALRDSLEREENVREAIRNDFAYEHEKQQLADSLARVEERTRHAGEVAVHRSRNRLLVSALLMAILIGAGIWSRMRYVARADRAIRLAQEQAFEAEKQRENEQVRTRIARDIHDDIGSGLTKIALLSSEAKSRVQHQAEELRATLDRITAHSREVSAALSDIVWSVDPAQDTSQELVGHAKALAQRLLADTGVDHALRFHHNEPGHPVAPGTKHNIVMVMKEAINNALKYAEAKHITVELEAGAHTFRLLVSDDGKGFDPGTMARQGNGLRNMKARAEAIGATLAVESAPGKGTTVTLEGALA